MAQSTFGGPMRVGDKGSGTLKNVGTPLLSQSTRIAQNSTNAVSKTLYLPKAAIIVDVIVDNLTAWNSATSAVLTIGTAAAGTQYASGVDTKVAGRVRPTFTAAQLTAMASIGSTTPVVATVTPAGATSAGDTKVTILYVMI
jgi:hypothetical protein